MSRQAVRSDFTSFGMANGTNNPWSYESENDEYMRRIICDMDLMVRNEFGLDMGLLASSTSPLESVRDQREENPASAAAIGTTRKSIPTVSLYPQEISVHVTLIRNDEEEDGSLKMYLTVNDAKVMQMNHEMRQQYQRLQQEGIIGPELGSISELPKADMSMSLAFVSPSMLYYWHCSKNAFRDLKAGQAIRVPFNSFASHLTRLLEQAANPSSPFFAVFRPIPASASVSMVPPPTPPTTTTPNPSSNSNSTPTSALTESRAFADTSTKYELLIAETSEFKIISHISLQFEMANDSFMRVFLSEKLMRLATTLQKRTFGYYTASHQLGLERKKALDLEAENLRLKSQLTESKTVLEQSSSRFDEENRTLKLQVDQLKHANEVLVTRLDEKEESLRVLQTKQHKLAELEESHELQQISINSLKTDNQGLAEQASELQKQVQRLTDRLAMEQATTLSMKVAMDQYEHDKEDLVKELGLWKDKHESLIADAAKQEAMIRGQAERIQCLTESEAKQKGELEQREQQLVLLGQRLDVEKKRNQEMAKTLANDRSVITYLNRELNEVYRKAK